MRAVWSQESYQYVLALCQETRPDVVHVHNFWMDLTPAAHAAAHDAGVPTVQTLHNYRLLCANGVFARDGKPCEDCLGKTPWRGVVRRCYRGSVAASAALVSMIVLNRRRGTWERDVDAFIALSGHSREKFVAGGLPGNRIFVKRNFVEDPGRDAPPPSASSLVVFAGRLSPEKNVGTLLDAWRAAGLARHGTLLVVGEGPERAKLEARAGAGVVFTGQRNAEETQIMLRAARVVVLPSVSENCPRTVLEALAHGRPVVAAPSGAVAELVRHGSTGLTCDVTDAGSLGAALELVMADAGLADRLGAEARQDYLARFTPERNFEELMEVYRYAIGGAAVQAERVGSRGQHDQL